jgi:hypothetical protein
MAGLDHTVCAAGANIIQHRAARAVNAGQPDQIERAGLRAGRPFLFGRNPSAGTIRAGLHVGILIDPAALPIAIDARGGEVAKPSDCQ